MEGPYNEDGSLKKGYWIDDQPEPLHTAADVKKLFDLVEALEAKQRGIATRKWKWLDREANLNAPD
jgi:hypothetical protein